ncbi:hypothetical protein HG537_0F01110 [Torulaspora globosa]|uniref:Dipeptidylpeptidase IV N-terminal domain-containing protein n=1 Tax=Torulaspora globosa TaxID=48254 RepID=A0A7H9HVF5_9SACH|nr:hypothetical protein HG537_0F01110 [Torulaspora sp. CBS 2947]
MDEEAVQSRCLWTSNDGYKLLMPVDNRCKFWLVQDKGKVLLEWEHDVKMVENVHWCSVNGSHVVKVVWNDLSSVYCDYVTISDSEANVKTELVIEVDFPVSACYPLWNDGLILLKEPSLAHLHIFDTGRGRYLGYITMFNSGSLAQTVRYDPETRTLWVIARKYDELTKKSAAYLNTYNISDLFMKTSLLLRQGFAHYSFIKPPPVKGLETFVENSVAVYSSCELLDKTLIQWFMCPKDPWRQTLLDHFTPLRPATFPETPPNLQVQPALQPPTIDLPRDSL